MFKWFWTIFSLGVPEPIYDNKQLGMQRNSNDLQA